jgi:hypothetical protein
VTVMSPAQIYVTARAAGFPIYAAQTMTAIVLAESGGDPAKPGDLKLTTAYWGPSVGLAQVRSVKSQSGTGKERDATKLTDPLFNLKAAYKISLAGTNWMPWTVYWTTDPKVSYKRYVATAIGARLSQDPIINKALAAKEPWANILLKAGVSAVPGGSLLWDGSEAIAGSIAGGVGDPLAAAKTGLAFLAKAGAWMGDSHNWARVAMVVAGSAGVLAGLAMLAKAGAGPVSDLASVPGKAAKVAASVVPAGRVAKVAGTAAKAAKAAKK